MKPEDSTFTRLKYNLPVRFEFGRYDRYARFVRDNLPPGFTEGYFGMGISNRVNGHYYDTTPFMSELVRALIEYEERRSNLP